MYPISPRVRTKRKESMPAPPPENLNLMYDVPVLRSIYYNLKVITSPSTAPSERTTAAAVSSQLVSIPSTVKGFDKSGRPDRAGAPDPGGPWGGRRASSPTVSVEDPARRTLFALNLSTGAGGVYTGEKRSTIQTATRPGVSLVDNRVDLSPTSPHDPLHDTASAARSRSIEARAEPF